MLETFVSHGSDEFQHKIVTTVMLLMKRNEWWDIKENVRKTKTNMCWIAKSQYL